MVVVYILRLENDKYYVGKSFDPDKRINQHFNGFGSEWTRKHKPIEVVELITDCDQFDEDKYTRKYMSLYGIDNVRGGAFVKLELSENEKEMLKNVIKGTKNQCFKCGNYGHFVNKCPLKTKDKVASVNTSEQCDCVTYS